MIIASGLPRLEMRANARGNRPSSRNRHRQLPTTSTQPLRRRTHEIAAPSATKGSPSPPTGAQRRQTVPSIGRAPPDRAGSSHRRWRSGRSPRSEPCRAPSRAESCAPRRRSRPPDCSGLETEERPQRQRGSGHDAVPETVARRRHQPRAVEERQPGESDGGQRQDLQRRRHDLEASAPSRRGC